MKPQNKLEAYLANTKKEGVNKMLKHQIKKSIKKRDDGETVLNLFPVILTSIIMLALVLVFSAWTRNVDTKDDLDQVCRKYMLKMETQGYLTDEMKDDLIDELVEAGMIRDTIQFSAVKNGKTYTTTTTEQIYGTQLYLVIDGEVNANNPEIAGVEEASNEGAFIKIISGDGRIHYTMIKGTTSKKHY